MRKGSGPGAGVDEVVILDNNNGMASLGYHWLPHKSFFG